MRKLSLTVIGLYLGILAAFSQVKSPGTDSLYKKRKLQLDEVNLVSSYYHQDGNNAATTGGTGSEKLSDFSNAIEVKLINWDKKGRKQNWTGEIGIDHYTSASSDKIDPKTLSSASSADTRVYPSLGWSRENEKKRTTFGFGVSSSTEFDYQSFGLNAHFEKQTKDKSGEFGARAQVYLDKLKLIYPVELRDTPGGGEDGNHGYGRSSRNSMSGSLSWSQIVNQRLQVMFLLDLVYQTGYLGLPFHRVYFNDGTVHVENLPDTRFKLPLGFRANYFLGDKIILRSYYRFYKDNWGITSHTINLETPVKLTPFFSISPFYRYYSQSAVEYFAPYLGHDGSKEYYTSNYDLSKFTSHFFGAGFRITPMNGLFGWKHFNMLEIRYGHYSRSTNLNSDIISLNLKYK
ncbi:DUF3570 domain-containing protein [Flavihumibacter rivuli]|uniref:DUF3570 domain-containing protein n=1 Tax=Flavihumibacter rivuli TaxID=2838156 RepID=UPI001BDF12D7|nr:DUF3570 domain-containing protein [Flavihumibacter rivuli]ULQ55578.1 DUF3570 domain-containing protein [Flavihumibacter rivuli]